MEVCFTVENSIQPTKYPAITTGGIDVIDV